MQEYILNHNLEVMDLFSTLFVISLANFVEYAHEFPTCIVPFPPQKSPRKSSVSNPAV